MRSTGHNTKKRKKCEDNDDLIDEEKGILFPLCRSPLGAKRQLNSDTAFSIEAPIQQGTYGIVSRGILNKTNQRVAIKQIINTPQDGLSVNSVRELVALRALNHDNIVKLYFATTDPDLTSIYLIMEYVENDLHTILRNFNRPFSASAVKTIVCQLLDAVAYLHENWYMHRDISAANILLTNNGRIKLADFGLCRKFGDKQAMLTTTVVTLYYRAPELLVLESVYPDEPYIDSDSYGPSVDLWSIGCIFAELMINRVLFIGKSDADQLHTIMSALIGEVDIASIHSINALRHLSESSSRERLTNLIPGLSSSGIDLLFSLLQIDPAQRLSAAAALNHQYFSETPHPLSADLLPTFPIRAITH